MNEKWIFFDVGSTLVDETEAYHHRIQEMIKGTELSFDTVDKKRIEFARLGFDGNSEIIRFFNLKKTPWHPEDELLFDDALDILNYLEEKGYKLGIIANQPKDFRQRLDSWELSKFFDVIAVSEEMGVSKPNKELFEIALSFANSQPNDSIMVGDRLDNDIIPAKSIGMKTIWIRTGLSKYQNTNLGENVADWTIDKLSDIKKLF